MRGLVLAAVMLGTMASAQAADMPDFLRGSVGGPSPIVNWRGIYVGAQGAWAESASTFTGSTMDHTVGNNLINGNIVNQIPGVVAPTPFGTSWHGSVPYGAFLGYNWQWDEVIIGLEGNYLHGNLGSTLSATRIFQSAAALNDGLFHRPTVTSTLGFGVTDYTTFRARAGYAYGCFLPYAFAGFALGYANTTTAATIADSVSATSNGVYSALPPVSAVGTLNNHVTLGYDAGLGLDISLIGGLFMRAEWEYVRFTSRVDTNTNTLRAGLGYKF